MTLPLPQLQALLLDMLSTRRTVAPAAINALDTADWDILLDMAREHRLEPMLHWRLTRERRELPVPVTVSKALAATYKEAVLYSMGMQRELLLTHRILEKAAIPHVALKGAYLAFHAYPHPALRPMRDLDILVPKDRVLEAYQVLIEGGLIRPEHYQGNPETCSLAQKHLPPLLSPSGLTIVELHNRLCDPAANHYQPDQSEDPQLWSRAIHREMAVSCLHLCRSRTFCCI